MSARRIWKRNFQRRRKLPKRTYQPKKIKRRNTHGFKARTATRGGRDVLKARRLKGRWRLTPV